jgi:preprotein translocase SecE subunit
MNRPGRRFYFGNILTMSLSNYIKATVAEMKQVSWPSQRLAFMYTILVIIIAAFVSVFLGVFDFLFARGVDFIIHKF